jgi:hypothetical protein
VRFVIPHHPEVIPTSIGRPVIPRTRRRARHAAPPAPAGPPAILFDNLGTHSHPVSTRSPEAQKFFDQGLRLMYGFNHDEATRSFTEATRLDPDCAMGWWGIALAAGPNYNDSGSPERDQRAYEALQEALRAKKKVSAQERAYIEALAAHGKPPTDGRRSTSRTRMRCGRSCGATDDLVRHAVRRIVDGPAPGTSGAATAALARHGRSRRPSRPPAATSANHYYIHAIEASKNPERALPSAARLETLVPAAGHLVHMPAHLHAGQPLRRR